MIGFHKDKYLKIELSEYELQIITAVIDSTYWKEGYWFSKQNLEDVQHLLNSSLNTETDMQYERT